MFVVDFLPVGTESKSGDAIVMRFDRPDGGGVAHVVIDGGFQETGPAVVDHLHRYYEPDVLDVVILSHPDGDHIGGLGDVVRAFKVRALLAHRPREHGGAGLRASDAVEELVELASSRGATIYEPFAGVHAFSQALLVAGPAEGYYEELIREQTVTRKEARQPMWLAEALGRAGALAGQLLTRFPIETDFDDNGGDAARNNSSTVIDLRLGAHRWLFTGDAGVPAINAALDFLDTKGRNDVFPGNVQIPHHGSRHNLDRRTVTRIAGPHTSQRRGNAYVSISQAAATDPRYPSPRVANAFGRRGYIVGCTSGNAIMHSDAGLREGWASISPLPPLDESIDDR